MINKALFSSKTDQWATPPDFFAELDREFHFDPVPCADERREEQKQAIAEELERLDQAVAVLIETIVAPFRRIGQRENGKRGGILAALKNARAAVRRILTRVFGKGGETN